MRMVDLILKKRDGGELTEDEIRFFVTEYTAERIPDYQASAMMMAIYFQGMNKRETADLTMAMAYSGDTVDLSSIQGVKVDKHSTGGVGDTTTLVAVPLAAACGIPVAKMSGKGLGHTGGTLDKLESIPGFNVNQTIPEFIRIVNKVGAAVIGQTQALVPADKKLYALRDVTGTIDNISLIASSIMSKKIAAGTQAIVLDVKTGSGAFMKSVEDSFDLAREMVDIGTNVGRKTTALVTDMDQPLGMAVGNALEVREAIEILKGSQKGPLREVSLLLGAYMLYTAGKYNDIDEARKRIEEVLEKGEGAAKLKEMIKAQGGDDGVVDDPDRLPGVKRILPIKADQEGCIKSIHADSVGLCALLLGAGRSTKEDTIDPGVGILLKKRVGDWVKPGDALGDFYINDEARLEDAVKQFKDAITIDSERPKERPMIYGVVTEKGIERW